MVVGNAGGGGNPAGQKDGWPPKYEKQPFKKRWQAHPAMGMVVKGTLFGGQWQSPVALEAKGQKNEEEGKEKDGWPPLAMASLLSSHHVAFVTISYSATISFSCHACWLLRVAALSAVVVPALLLSLHCGTIAVFVLASLPLSPWHPGRHCAGVVAHVVMASLPLLCWSCCPGYTGIFVIVVLALSPLSR
jgi:hypothetical protein